MCSASNPEIGQARPQHVFGTPCDAGSRKSSIPASQKLVLSLQAAENAKLKGCISQHTTSPEFSVSSVTTGDASCRKPPADASPKLVLSLQAAENAKLTGRIFQHMNPRFQ